ncbi:MAG: glycosyltransferase family 9 protein [Planctomycetota bacterium]
MQLVFHQAALGDFVLAVSTLRRLPAAEGPVVLVVPWSHGRVAARLMPDAKVLDAELFEFTRLWSEDGPSTVSPAVAEVFHAARRVVNFVAEPDSAWTKNVGRVCGDAPIVTVRPRPDTDSHRPIRVWHGHQLEAQGVRLDNESEATLFGTPLLADNKPNPGRRWAIHPGSGGVAKCWPVAHFAALAERLIERGDACDFLVGPAEIERGVADALRDRLDDAVRIQELREIDALCFALADATHYLGNDAGPTHLAAQLGLPTTALFGPSDPRVWAPVGPQTALVAPKTPQPMAWLSVETASVALLS